MQIKQQNFTRIKKSKLISNDDFKFKLKTVDGDYDFAHLKKKRKKIQSHSYQLWFCDVDAYIIEMYWIGKYFTTQLSLWIFFFKWIIFVQNSVCIC